MPGITAILLAAGLSRRFGADNKLLVAIDGEPMVRRVAKAICASKATHVIVVLGHQAKQVAHALCGLELETIVNPDYRDGQVSSVRAGVGAVDAGAHGFMMCLADQPLLKTDDYNVLIDAFAQRDDQVLVPFVAGKRANPVVFPITVRKAILTGGVNVGCRKFIDAHPELVFRLDVTHSAYRNDFDTPHAFAAYAQKDDSAQNTGKI